MLFAVFEIMLFVGSAVVSSNKSITPCLSQILRKLLIVV